MLAKGQPLYEDPLHLLREGEGIRDPATYFSILRTISGGATQHNQIATRIGIASSNLGPRLARLEELGYVTGWAPLSADGPEPRRTSYRIADPYFGFFFRYVFPNRSRLERGRVDEVAHEVLADLDNVMGRAFEDACRTWVGRYADERRSGAATSSGRGGRATAASRSTSSASARGATRCSAPASGAAPSTSACSTRCTTRRRASAARR